MKPIQGAAKAFIQATRGDVVSEDEISRRARICKSCPGRIPNKGTGKISQILAKVAGENQVPKEIANYQCAVCGCNLQLLIPAKEPHQDSDKERKRREKINPRCWLLK